VPTFQEAGIQGLVLDQWLGVFVLRVRRPLSRPREFDIAFYLIASWAR